jgi:hypothetical protein
MQGQAYKMCSKPIVLNPVTRLWQSIETNSYLKHSLYEFLKIAELAVVMVLGSVQDEWTFSTVSFMKNKLRNRLSKNLELACAFKSQDFFILDNFPYDAAYDSWRDETKRKCDTSLNA